MAYTQPSTMPVKDAADKEVADFGEQDVTNDTRSIAAKGCRRLPGRRRRHT